MKLQIKRETKEEVEITLPIYRKDSTHYYFIFKEPDAYGSNDNCIQVFDSDWGSIIHCYASLAYVSKDTIDCSKKDFEAAYNRVKKLLDSKLIFKK